MVTILKGALELLDYFRSRAFAVALLSLALAFTIFRASELTNVVSIRDGDDVQVHYTMESDPAKILADVGVVTLAYDAVDVSELDGKITDINVDRAFPVIVRVDGSNRKVMTTGGTVGELLTRAAIDLGKLDEVDKPLDQKVEAGNIITVTRKEYVNLVNEEVLPYETVVYFSPHLEPGTEEVQVEGEEGLRVQEIRQFLVNGEVEKETLKSDEIVKEPVTQEIAKAFPVKPISQLDFEWGFDENGEPLEYSRVLRSQKSAGYYAAAGSKTASGMDAKIGHVAVNPKVIPYGTKLFVRSSDGKHIYGYAVAADTGTSLINGTITIDLFYGSYEACMKNGNRAVDIFIVE